ncbi:nitrate ABC transporter ATP-binding protein [Ancylothrix sp. C2]|nr:nitrate ABC transporter ATP-binding protein [Ancylothrix sp. D3o]MCT7951160.1 nitrate ABC transporter ATP-binding protein [Ancylothrix sp. D3o]
MQTKPTLVTNPTGLQQEPAVNKESFLVINNVSKVYPTPKGPYTVLEDVNFTAKEGEFICVIGHSGCGKSTLLNMVSGFNTPTTGEVTLEGKLITKPGPDRMMVFQNYALLPWKTVYENVYLAVKTAFPQKSKEEKDSITREHLEMVGLTEAANKRPTQISGGMKQRVAIARALSIRPKMLILDEPFGALDAITKEELQEELLQIWREYRVTVLMITHDIDEALFLADRLVMMTNGPHAKIGEVLEIPFARPRVRSQVMEDPRYYELRNYALDFLFRRFAHDEVPEEETKPVKAAVPSVVPSGVPSTVPVVHTNTTPTPKPMSTQEKHAGHRDAMIVTAATAALFALGGAFHGLSQLTGAQKMASTPAVAETVATPSPTPAAVSSPTPAAISSPTPAETTPAAATSTLTSAETTPAGQEQKAEKITDPAKLSELKQKLFDSIDKTWQTSPTFAENLVYRVKVMEDGTLGAFEGTSQTAKDFVKETPLQSLVKSGANLEKGPVAEFQVVFSPAGTLEVK